MFGEAEAVARALSGRRTGRGWLCLCPAHDNKRTPALSVGESAEGRLLLKCHAGCDGREVLAALAARGIVTGHGAEAWHRPSAEQIRRRQEQERRKRDAARHRAIRLFAEGVCAAATPVATYLASRGLAGICLERLKAVLRFHAHCLHAPSGQKLPAMLALVRGSDGRATGLHRTYLKPDGWGKAGVEPNRMMLGPCAGGAVRFGPDRDFLVLTEGIETALSIARAARVTVWACLSTSGLRAVQLPPSVRAGRLVAIAADHDRGGLEAAKRAAERLRTEGRAVTVLCPDTEGADWNDILQDREPRHGA